MPLTLTASGFLRLSRGVEKTFKDPLNDIANIDPSSAQGKTILSTNLRSLESTFKALMQSFEQYSNDCPEDVTDEMLDDTYHNIMKIYSKLVARHEVLLHGIPETPRVSQFVPSANSTEVTAGAGGSNESARLNTSQVNLPKLKLSSFTGEDVSQFDNFITRFDSLITKSPHFSNLDRLEYLLDHLSGQALKVVSHLDFKADNFEVAIKLLKDRYANPRRVISIHANGLLNLPNITNEAESIRKFLDMYKAHYHSLNNHPKVTHVEDVIFSQFVLSKFSMDLRNKFEMGLTDATAFPEVKDLIEFLDSHVVSLENIFLNTSSISSMSSSYSHASEAPSKCPKVKKTKSKNVKTSLAVSLDTCTICKSAGHLIDKCTLFLSKSPEERFQLVKTNHVCPRCLHPSHQGTNCKGSTRCTSCGSRGHHSLLHFSKPADSGNQHSVVPSTTSIPTEQTESIPPASCITCNNSSSNITPTNVLMATCLVKLKVKTGQNASVRAILDTASQVSFISEHCAQLLRCQRIPSSSAIKGVGTIVTTAKSLVYLSVQSLSGEVICENNPFLVLDKITTDTPKFSVPADIRGKVKHLQLADPTFDHTSPVDCLLGANLAALVLSGNIVSLGVGYPVAVDTKLGFVIMGSTPSSSGATSTASESQASVVSLAVDVNHELLQAVHRFWAIEEPDRCSEFSPDELQCEKYYQETVVRMPSGRFQVRLPFKPGTENSLGNSHNIALKRFNLLERKFEKNPLFKDLYTDFMRTYAKEKHMVPYLNPGPSKYFIPHHGIFKSHGDTTKIRVVFDASTKTVGNMGCSLNDILWPGPKLQANITDILLYFRLNNFVWVCDIEQCFRQIAIHPDDQEYQCILWRESPSAPVQVMTLTTVTYGTASAPYLSERTLRELANREASTYPAASQVLLNNRFVDDMHGGGHTVEAAIQLRDELIELMSGAGFTLKKWAANSPELIESLPQSHILPLNPGQCVKVLGLDWLQDKDVLKFPVDEMVRPREASTTKRGVLSDTARLYDPCGLIAPVVFKAKVFLQQLWRRNLSWDSPLPPDDQEAWHTFIESLQALKSLCIPRPINIQAPSIQLHGFSDASTHGYAGCLYIRIQQGDSYRCYLIASRTRVAPLKPITIPRLELMGAHLLSKMYDHYLPVLKSRVNISSSILWTDSTIVLDWINTPPHLLKTFVGNRVSQILDWTSSCTWNHVPGSMNPSDISSRGIAAAELVDNTCWWEGPPFLTTGPSCWPSPVYEKSHSQEDLELKPQSSLVVSSDSKEQMLFAEFSSWIKLVKTVSVIVKWKFIAKQQNLDPFSLRKTAITLILRYIQSTSSLASDISLVHSNKPASTAVQRLNPFIDECGILRARGRLTNVALSTERFLIILPKCHSFVTLLIRHYHIWLGHAGPSQVQFQLSLTYWILAARQVIRRIIHECVTCFKICPRPTYPIMGDLPACRVNPAPPFHHTGMDFCGPFLLKSSKLRKAPLLKGYLCIFVCMATKALHLEVAQDLTTQEFIDCLKRLIGRRGVPSTLYSDCGTNFVGACSELKKQLKNFLSESQNSKLIQDFALENQFEFVFSCPSAPHQGGLWERAVRSTKYHLKRVVGNQVLTFAQFTSLAIQIEGLLNSRPLTPLSSEPHDYEALTPGHFLIGRPLTAPPCPDLSVVNDGTLRHYQLVQALLQRYWKRWRVEYLSTLQARSKWSFGTPNLGVGDLVVVYEPNTPPSQWPLGRILQVFPGKDGVVRRATVKTKSGQYERPAVKLYRLPISS